MSKTFIISTMNKFSSLLLSFCLCTGMFLLLGCDDESLDIPEEDEETVIPATATITADEVKSLFTGKVALIGGDGTLLNYFQKRLPNTTNTITDDIHVALMNEQMAETYLNDETLFAALRKHWLNNRTIGVFNPSVNTFKLFLRLKGREMTSAEIDENIKDAYGNSVFYMANAYGKSMSYQKPDRLLLSYTDTDMGTGSTTTQEEKEVTFTLSDYQWGKVAERATEWMNENSIADAASQAAAFVRATDSDYEYKTVSHKVYKQVTVNHNNFIELTEFGTGPGTTTTEAVIEVKGAAGFNEANNCDIYDIQVSEIFDGGDTYVKNYVTKKSAAYKYKYSGGCYVGPTVKLNLKDIDSNKVTIHEPVPIGTPGSYTTLHNPGSWTLGGGASRGVSGGTSGAEASKSLSFSFSYTLPSVSVSYVHEEMPSNFTDYKHAAEWTYKCARQDIYKYRAGLNAVYENPPLDIMLTDCRTEQAVTFKVDNSRELAKKEIYMSGKFRYSVYQEVCSPWDWYYRYSHYTYHLNFQLPEVYRYYDKFTPYCYKSSDKGDSASWSNLETLLKGNVNYKSFCNENLKVGAIVEEDVIPTAQALWESAITSLVNQYNGTSTTHEYVVALAGTNGKPLSMGLHIKNGTWTLVKDITTITIEAK